MAVRDRNLFAQQAYVITMSFVSVGLLLGMFFLWRSYSDLQAKSEDQASQLQTVRQEFSTSEGRVDRLLSMMGYGENTEDDLQRMASQFENDERLAQVEKDFVEQMKLFAPNMPLTEKNLLKLPKYLLETIRIRNTQIEESREREKRLRADMTAKFQEETAAREEAQRKMQQAQEDLAAARQTHSEQISRLNKEKNEVLSRFDSYKQTMDQRYAKLDQEKSRLEKENAEQAETIALLTEEVNQFRDPDFASPQGEILRVADGGTTVWLTLGKEDGLRPGVPFSVIDESEVRVSDATPKANLVVTRVVSDHLSQARVPEGGYDIRTPIVPGDKVYSPAWRPGRKVGFALVGNLDINGDRRDDSDQVKELIRLAGGEIDAEMDTKGVRNSSLPGLNPNTSYLVLGTDVTVGPGATPQQKSRAEQYARFISEARGYGIQQWSIDKLMGYLKTDNSDRTVPLGNRLREGDFPIAPEVSPPTSTGSVSEIFTERRPK